ncbi:hypothetical protein [Daejeonella sp.]|uniref:hypothetical protein n=1 Tax=Daejeonella sp. TaxID=2805397 RepID=UPI0030BAEE3B
MELNDRDIDWQKDAPTLAAIGKAIPFTVPAGYFEDLSGNLNSRLLIESMRVDDKDGFRVPHNYFENLSSRIEESVAVGNLKALAPSEGFTLPEGYFAGLTERINTRIEESAKRKTPVGRLLTSWVSYAAAACITVMIATGIYFNSDSQNFNEQLSEVPDEEIINYLQAHSTAGDTPFIIETLNPDGLDQVTPDVSADELEQYINSTTL